MRISQDRIYEVWKPENAIARKAARLMISRCARDKKKLRALWIKLNDKRIQAKPNYNAMFGSTYSDVWLVEAWNKADRDILALILRNVSDDKFFKRLIAEQGKVKC